MVVPGLIEGVGLEAVISASGLLHVVSGFTSVQLFGSIFMIPPPHASIFHLFPLSPPPPSFHAPSLPPCRQTQCQHDVGLAQCVGLMGKEKSLNMQKGLFNPHFFNSFFVVQHNQLNPLVLEMSLSHQNKKEIALLHYIHDFIPVSERRLAFGHFKT